MAKRNAIAADLRTNKFAQRIIRDKKKYSRKIRNEKTRTSRGE